VDQCPQITHGKECNHNLQKRPVPKRSGAPVAKQNKTKQNKTKQNKTKQNKNNSDVHQYVKR